MRSPVNQAPKPAAAAAAAPKATTAKTVAGLSTAKSTISFVSNKAEPVAAPTAAAPTAAVSASAPPAAAAAAPAAAASPAPVAAASEEKAAVVASSPVAASSSSSSSSSSSASVAEVTKGVASVSVDPEEARKLAEVDEEKRKKAIQVTSSYATRKTHDEREHINIVFIGHVDAGKVSRRQGNVDA